MATILIGVVAFTTIIFFLVATLLLAKSRLVQHGAINIVINQDESNAIVVPAGDTLLKTLASQKIFVPSPCGGRASCGSCKIRVASGGGAILPIEQSLVTPAEARRGIRLACQVKVKRDLAIDLPPDVLTTRKWVCTVRSNRNVATFIKELVLELPEGEVVPFRAGGYIQVQCPPHQLSYTDFDIDPTFRDSWDQLGLWQYSSRVSEPAHRSYSMANYPDERGILILNVRIESPPPQYPHAPPGIVSSYLFSLKPGDILTVTGPFGEFFARATDAEMIFIGGGAGMAPMRSHIFDQLERLQTSRKITFWYGARSLREAFYIEDFDYLAQTHANFDWTLVLSSPLPEDNWNGPTGFIHEVVYKRYLAEHPAPEDAEYYLCGPPPMIDACQKMLDELGVEPDNILFDKFG